VQQSYAPLYFGTGEFFGMDQRLYLPEGGNLLRFWVLEVLRGGMLVMAFLYFVMWFDAGNKGYWV